MKALEEYLISEDDELRRKGSILTLIDFIQADEFLGVDFLASVLVKAPSSSFNVQSSV